SGTLDVKTEGVGRDELLKKLTGRGDFQLKAVELRGWDVNASVAEGAVHAGISRWTAGQGSIHLRDSSITFEDFRLNGGNQLTLVNGTLSFGRTADLSVETASVHKSARSKPAYSEASPILRISGPLDGPTVSVEKAAVRQPAD